MYRSLSKIILVVTFSLLVSSCAYKPNNIDNICQIFLGDIDWYEDAKEANKRWGTPIYVMMAIMHQESSFVAHARPPREWFLWVIPLPRSSSAYGYAQAQDASWEEYKKATRRWRADRDDFDDAIDFIGWYTHLTQRKLNVSKWDAYNQYLAYHEGRGGYSRKTYNKKPWLKKVANKVKLRAAKYNKQLKGCQARLDDRLDSSWF
jgi:hypothetical protein